MKRSAGLMIIFLLVVGIFCSCEKSKTLRFSSYEDSYNSMTDYDPTLWKESNYQSFYAQSDNEIYFIAGSYLFCYSLESQTAYPLCYKTTCLHNEETDDLKRSFCEAYIGTSVCRFIQEYDDFLFLICMNKNNGTNELIKMRKDGSEKTVLLDDLDAKGIQSFVMHRGVLFYQTITVSPEGEKTVELSAVSTLSKKNKAVSIFKKTGQERESGYICEIFPFEKYIYYTYSHFETDEEGEIKEIRNTYRYNTEAGESEEIWKEQDLTICGVYKNQIIIRNGTVSQYYYYEPKSNTIEPIEGGIQAFVDNHPDWNCHIDCIDDSLIVLECYDKVKQDFITDLIIVDQNGEEISRIPGEAWFSNAGSRIVRTQNEAFYLCESSSMSPFSVCLYKEADLLQGIVEPIIVLQVDDFNQDLNQGAVTQSGY